jgi:L-lactate dehydrogenase complex protein LldE
MRIALFATCLADTLFPDVAKATVTVLERLGHRVDFPLAQTCCGQMHVNTGYQREALPLIRRYTDTFEPHEVIVVPSGSCAGSIAHQHAMVARRHGDERLAERAVAARTYELSQLLIDVLGVEDVGALPAPRGLSPDLPLAAAAAGGRPAAAAAAAGGRDRPGPAAGR